MRYVMALAVVAATLGGLGCAQYGGTKVASEAMKSLAGTAWQIQSIGDQPVIDPAKTELRFAQDGSVSGSAGCNRFTGKATLEGTAVKFSPLAMTRMACTPEVDAQEMRFTQAIGQVAGWATDAGGALKLTGADGAALMTLAPSPK